MEKKYIPSMNEYKPIPNLTTEQAIKLAGRYDLPDDIKNQVNAVMVGLQMQANPKIGGF